MPELVEFTPLVRLATGMPIPPKSVDGYVRTQGIVYDFVETAKQHSSERSFSALLGSIILPEELRIRIYGSVDSLVFDHYAVPLVESYRTGAMVGVYGELLGKGVPYTVRVHRAKLLL